MKKSIVLLSLLSLCAAVFADGRFSPLGISIDESKVPGHDAQFPGRYDYVYGWRLALFSGAHSRMVGFATAVFVNNDGAANGYVGGLQVASLLNSAGDCELGVWQICSLSNEVKRNCNGFQICAFYNEVGGYFNGIQASLYNNVASDVGALQVGVVNCGGSVSGLQIGLVNFADSLQGIQLGVLNFVENSIMAVFPVVRIGW